MLLFLTDSTRVYGSVGLGVKLTSSSSACVMTFPVAGVVLPDDEADRQVLQGADQHLLVHLGRDLVGEVELDLDPQAVG